MCVSNWTKLAFENSSPKAENANSYAKWLFGSKEAFLHARLFYFIAFKRDIYIYTKVYRLLQIKSRLLGTKNPQYSLLC